MWMMDLLLFSSSGRTVPTVACQKSNHLLADFDHSAESLFVHSHDSPMQWDRREIIAQDQRLYVLFRGRGVNTVNFETLRISEQKKSGTHLDLWTRDLWRSSVSEAENCLDAQCLEGRTLQIKYPVQSGSKEPWKLNHIIGLYYVIVVCACSHFTSIGRRW